MVNFTKPQDEHSESLNNDFYDLDDLFALKEMSHTLTKIAIRVASLTQRSLAISGLVKQDPAINQNFKSYEYRPGAMPSSTNQTHSYAEQDYSQISALKKIGQDQSRITHQPLRGARRQADSSQPLPQKSD